MKHNPDAAALAEATRVQKRYQKAADRAEALRPERDRAVVAALDAGNSMRKVAAATGIHLARVGQISKARHSRLV